MYLDIIYVSVAQHLNSLKSACIVTKLFMQHVHVIPLCSLSNSFVSIFHWPFADELQYSERQSCLVKIGSTLVPSNCHAVYTGLCFFLTISSPRPFHGTRLLAMHTGGRTSCTPRHRWHSLLQSLQVLALQQRLQTSLYLQRR